MPTGEAIFLRGLLTTLFCASLLFSLGTPGSLPHAVSPKIIGRAIAEIGSTLFFLSALVRMPIGDAIAILQFTPLAITAGAALFLGDKVGWRRWLATCVGLLGVLIIVRPGGTGFNPYSVLALLSIIGVVAAAVLNGTPVDMGTVGGLVQVALLALGAFIASHGSYTLFWKK